MSLVVSGVEVAGRSTVGLKDHVSIPVYLQQHGDNNNSNSKNNNDHKREEEEEEEKGKRKKRNGFFIEDKVVEEESSETSSIGVQSSDSSSEKGEENEVQSKANEGAFGSLDSLEESLPIKRGLSNFFSGKSKSFASLADVAAATARDLVKPENPFNKRRRLLMASRTRRASYASLMTCLPPLLSSDDIAEEKENEEDEDEDEQNSGDSSTLAPLPPHVSKVRKIKKAFRSPRSFSLSDLQNV